jgi:sporulation protein YlmC with PRC-barrel domain
MQFKLGAGVYTSDNRQVGTVDHIVIEPQEKEVTHLVVRKGFLFTKDKVVPVSAVQSADAVRVVLQHSTSGLDEFQDFEESHYVPSEGEEWPEERREERSGGAGSTLIGYPSIGAASMGAAPQYLAKIRNIPDDTVALKEGAKVISSDDHHVGNVERVITGLSVEGSHREGSQGEGPIEGHATHLVISQGLLLKTRKLVPTDWIAHVMEGEIDLAVDARFLDSLPEYRPEMQT